MEYKVKITPEALEQAEQAYLWILEQLVSREIANKWFTGLIATTETLARHPARCPYAPENGYFKEEIRQLLHGKKRSQYRIIFTVIDDIVHVLHIRHTAMKYIHEED